MAPIGQSASDDDEEEGGGACEIVDENATARQLRCLLCTSTRQLLFIGHGDASDPGGAGHTLGFTAEGGGLETVKAQDVAAVPGASGTGNGGATDLIFLNGCNSEALGQAARDNGVPTAICRQTKELDPAARLFSTTFFQSFHSSRHSTYTQPGLRRGRSIGASQDGGICPGRRTELPEGSKPRHTTLRNLWASYRRHAPAFTHS